MSWLMKDGAPGRPPRAHTPAADAPAQPFRPAAPQEKPINLTLIGFSICHDPGRAWAVGGGGGCMDVCVSRGSQQPREPAGPAPGPGEPRPPDLSFLGRKKVNETRLEGGLGPQETIQETWPGGEGATDPPLSALQPHPGGRRHLGAPGSVPGDRILGPGCSRGVTAAAQPCPPGLCRTLHGPRAGAQQGDGGGGDRKEASWLQLRRDEVTGARTVAGSPEQMDRPT